MKGISYTTGTVHYAKRKAGHLVQACGMGRRQLAYLAEADESAEVTCGRCAGSKKS